MKKILQAIGVALALGGCQAASINDLDRELVDLYRTKLELEKQEGPLAFGADAVRIRFADLAKKAQEGATNTNDKELLNKISFLRIALTARWQSYGVSENGAAAPSSTVESLGTAGSDICADTPALWKTLPRDCALFEVMPIIARQDTASREVYAWGVKLRAGQERGNVEAFKKLKENFDALLTQADKNAKFRSTKSDLPVPEDFWNWMDRQRLYAYCDAKETIEVTASLVLTGQKGESQACKTQTTPQMTLVTKPLENDLMGLFDASDLTKVCEGIKNAVPKWKRAVKPAYNKYSPPDYAGVAACQ